MEFEIEQRCGAEYGERSADRNNNRNGYRDRLWETRAGAIDLRIPSFVKEATFQRCSSLGERPRKRWSPSCKKHTSKAYRRAPSMRSFRQWA